MRLLQIINVVTPDLGETTSVRFEFYATGPRTLLVAHTLCGTTIEGTNFLAGALVTLEDVVKQFIADDNHESFPRHDEWL